MVGAQRIRVENFSLEWGGEAMLKYFSPILPPYPTIPATVVDQLSASRAKRFLEILAVPQVRFAH